jgi:hypothetical protein
MTLTRLYCENGNRAGFWVQHRTWTNVCAQVQSVGGHRDGVLPSASAGPATSASAAADDAAALLKFFDVRSGRPMPLPPASGQPTGRNYVRIAEPSWYVRPATLGWGTAAAPECS